MKIIKIIIIASILAIPGKYMAGYYAYADTYPTLTKIKYEASKQACKKYNIDLNLHLATGWAESRFIDGATSYAGAIGDWQVMPVHHPSNPEELYNPFLNAEKSAKYLRHCLNVRKGNVAFALAGYNQGANRSLALYKGWRSYVMKICDWSEKTKGIQS